MCTFYYFGIYFMQSFELNKKDALFSILFLESTYAQYNSDIFKCDFIYFYFFI